MIGGSKIGGGIGEGSATCDDGRLEIDASGRHRVATSGAHLATAGDGVIGEMLLHRVLCRSQIRLSSSVPYSAHVDHDASRSERTGSRGVEGISGCHSRATAVARERDRAPEAAESPSCGGCSSDAARRKSSARSSSWSCGSKTWAPIIMLSGLQWAPAELSGALSRAHYSKSSRSHLT